MSLEEQLIASTAVANYRSNQVMEKCIFEVNIPQTVALKYANGKRVESRYNEYEMYFSLTDGRALYASPALATKIEALAPAAGELFSICKKEVRDGQRKRIEWQVAPAEDRSQETEDRRPATPAPRLVTPAPKSVPIPTPVSSTPDSSSSTMTQIMSGALVAAIDSLAQATAYAREKHNWELMFGADDVRAAANSIVIQFFKDRETRARYGGTTAPERVNGGAAWQQ